MAHDARVAPARVERRSVIGLGLAVVSATTFGLSGPLASGLLDTGWSPGSLVLLRVAIGALVMLPFGIASLRGHRGLLRRTTPLIATYGLLAVAGAQLCYFQAVSRMQVGPAMMIEYTAPATVVLWMWARHGLRPGLLTLLGAGVAALGLVLVLDLVSGGDLDPAGVLWALGAMVGVSAFFVISADEGNGLPPMALAAGGLVVGAAVLGASGAVGVLPLHATSVAPTYAGHDWPWWLPVLGLGLLTAAVSYTTGIAAGRRLGSRLASFVALLEVVAAVGFAWLLLDQLPRPTQLVGGALIVGGVVVVKLGERPLAPRTPED